MSLKRNVRGHFFYIAMSSVFSGLGVTGIAGNISGRRSTDGGSQTLLSGSIAEIGGGQYVVKLFDWDVSGNFMGYLFTSSGCSPVNYSVVTLDAVSGWFYEGSGVSFGINSGQQVNVFSGQLSGQAVNLLSGNQVGVWSGTQINTFSGQLSGQAVGILSGQLSGYTVTGVLSGQLSGFVVNLLSGNQVGVWSGTNVNLFSGTKVNVFSGQLSGYTVDLTSGKSYLASGVYVASGGFANAAVSIASGSLSGFAVDIFKNYDKSGYYLNASGLDDIQIESGFTFRQSIALIGAANAGRLSGAGTTNIQIGNASGVMRINATVDASGNRTQLVLTPPA